MEGKCSGQKLKASMTVEASLLMPIILLLIMSSIFGVFYYHDKNVLAGAAYETAVVGSTKMREAEPPEAEELKAFFAERASGKCILFSGYSTAVVIRDEEIEINVTASKGKLSLSVVKRAAVTEPEKHIRNIRRIEGIGKGIRNGAKDNN